MDAQRGDALGSGSHLGQLFSDLAARGLGQVNIRDEASVGYIRDLMAGFVSTEALYPLRNREGGRVEHLSDLLAEAHGTSDVALRRERFRYLGDFSLFMLGMFPEQFRRGRRALARDFYRLQGRSSYQRVARLVHYRSEPTVFRALADRYDDYVEGLHWVRRYTGDPFFQYMFREFGIF